MPQVFQVIRRENTQVNVSSLTSTTIHWVGDRAERRNLINANIGVGNIVSSFLVNTDHKNGHEIHHITDSGIIIIENAHTHEMVTQIVARPKQISRYWEQKQLLIGRNILSIIDKAREHQKRGWNNW